MELKVERSRLRGAIEIPASKSHTIRAVAIATLAEGSSEILQPLYSSDSLSCVEVCRALGAEISLELEERWRVKGVGGKVQAPADILDVRNSGTTCRITMGMASLAPGFSVFTGDEQTRRRPMQPLLTALGNLGAQAFSTQGNGRLPAVIGGRLHGGQTEVEGLTSQYLTSLLISCPLAEKESELWVKDLHERPYVEMTMAWLDRQGIQYDHRGLDYFRIPGGQCYRAFQARVPADFSSATFFLCAAAIADAEVTLLGLDMQDSQGDKKVVAMLQEMGADIRLEAGGAIVVRGGWELIGRELDLNDTPDALPALAVVGCHARGTTVLKNVPQARIKETDRIATMRQELSKLGARVEELPDGLVIEQSPLRGAQLHGHGDHRVVMSLAVAGLIAEGATQVDTAEAIQVTFPSFVELMGQLGAKITLSD